MSENFTKDEAEALAIRFYRGTLDSCPTEGCRTAGFTIEFGKRMANNCQPLTIICKRCGRSGEYRPKSGKQLQWTEDQQQRIWRTHLEGTEPRCPVDDAMLKKTSTDDFIAKVAGMAPSGQIGKTMLYGCDLCGRIMRVVDNVIKPF